jgi:hypothetical protein
VDQESKLLPSIYDYFPSDRATIQQSHARSERPARSRQHSSSANLGTGLQRPLPSAEKNFATSVSRRRKCEPRCVLQPHQHFSRTARAVLEQKQRMSEQDDFSDDEDDFAATLKSKARSERLTRPEQHLRHLSPARICSVRPQRALCVPAASRLQHAWIKRASAAQASKMTYPATQSAISQLVQD